MCFSFTCAGIVELGSQCSAGDTGHVGHERGRGQAYGHRLWWPGRWASASSPERLLEMSSVCGTAVIMDKARVRRGVCCHRPVLGSAVIGRRKPGTPGAEGETERACGAVGAARRAAVGVSCRRRLLSPEPPILLCEHRGAVCPAPAWESLVLDSVSYLTAPFPTPRAWEPVHPLEQWCRGRHTGSWGVKCYFYNP